MFISFVLLCGSLAGTTTTLADTLLTQTPGLSTTPLTHTLAPTPIAEGHDDDDDDTNRGTDDSGQPADNHPTTCSSTDGDGSVERTLDPNRIILPEAS